MIGFLRHFDPDTDFTYLGRISGYTFGVAVRADAPTLYELRYVLSAPSPYWVAGPKGIEQGKALVEQLGLKPE